MGTEADEIDKQKKFNEQIVETWKICDDEYEAKEEAIADINEEIGYVSEAKRFAGLAKNELEKYTNPSGGANPLQPAIVMIQTLMTGYDTDMTNKEGEKTTLENDFTRENGTRTGIISGLNAQITASDGLEALARGDRSKAKTVRKDAHDIIYGDTGDSGEMKVISDSKAFCNDKMIHGPARKSAIVAERK